MGLFAFLKRKFGKKKDAPETEPRMELTGVDLSGAEPLETRYTQEYRDFLARQEAERASGRVPGDGGAPEAPAAEEKPETDES